MRNQIEEKPVLLSPILQKKKSPVVQKEQSPIADKEKSPIFEKEKSPIVLQEQSHVIEKEDSPVVVDEEETLIETEETKEPEVLYQSDSEETPEEEVPETKETEEIQIKQAQSIFKKLEASIGKKVKGDAIDAKLRELVVKLARMQSEAIAQALQSEANEKDRKIAKFINKVNPEFAYLSKLSMEQLEQTCSCLVPLVRIDSGKYLVGAEQKTLILKESSLLVRVGGGFSLLEDHIRKVALSECLKIYFQMNKESLEFKQAVLNLLTKLNVDKVVKEKFMAADHSN